MIEVGNCLQMPQQTQRLNGFRDDGRLDISPEEPDYPWNASVFQNDDLRVLKVRNSSYR